MPLSSKQNEQIKSIILDDTNCYKIKRIYNKDKELSVVQVLDIRGRIYKCLFYSEGKTLSNLSVYNPDTGKEIRNVTYRHDGMTISSIREYYTKTHKISSVTFFKEDGCSPSSVVKYNELGDESHFILYCDDGEVIKQSF